MIFGVWPAWLDALLEGKKAFVSAILNGITLAGLYFLVASGFTLVFGLMRNVNLAHGSLYLLGAYIGYDFAHWTGNWWLGVARRRARARRGRRADAGVGVPAPRRRRTAADAGDDRHLHRRRRSDARGLGRQDLSVRDSRLRSTARSRCRSSPPIKSNGQAVFLRFPFYRLVVFAASVVIGVALWLGAQPHQDRHDDPRRRRRPRDAVGRGGQRAPAVRRRVRHRRRAGRLLRRHRRLGAVGRARRGRALSAGLAGRRHRRRHGVDHRRRDRRAADRPRRATGPRLFPDLRRRADLRHHGGDAGAAAAGHARQRAAARRRSAAPARRERNRHGGVQSGDGGARAWRWCCFRCRLAVLGVSDRRAIADPRAASRCR